MPNPIVTQLETKEGMQAFDKHLFELLRQDRFDEANQYFVDGLQGIDTEISRECMALKPGSVAIEGWDEMMADLVKKSEKYSCAALGLDLTDQYHFCDEPHVWCGYYSNEEFDFSSATRADILAANSKYHPKWTGCAVSDNNLIKVCGASDLQVAVHKFATDHDGWKTASIEEKSAYWIGKWVIFTRFCEAVMDKVKNVGLPKKMPVLVGVDAERQTWIETVHMCEKIADHAAKSKQINAAKLSEVQTVFDKWTNDEIAAITDIRRRGRSFGLFFNPDKKAAIIKTLEWSEKMKVLQYKASGLVDKPAKHYWEMNDKEFDAYIKTFRDTRNTRRPT